MIRPFRFLLPALALAACAGLCVKPALAFEKTSFITQQGGLGFLGLSLTPLQFEAERAAAPAPVTILGFRLSPALRFDARPLNLADSLFAPGPGGHDTLSFRGLPFAGGPAADGPDIGLDLSETLSMHGGYRLQDAADLGMADMGFDYQGHELRIGFSYKLK